MHSPYNVLAKAAIRMVRNSIVQLIFIASFFCVASSVQAQFDYQFWMPPIWQTGDAQQNAPSEIFITTPYPTPVNVHIETPDGTTFVFNGTVTAAAPLIVPMTAILSQTNIANQVMTNNGLIVTSTRPIQCVHRVSAFYNQTLVTLKGKNGRGTDFWCGSQTRNGTTGQTPNAYHFISVMAMENNTQIVFTTPAGMFTAAPGDLPNPYTITLNAKECYLIRTNDAYQTVAGSHVTSNKEIVVISGSTHTPITGGNARDGGTDQLVPVQLAGTAFALIKGFNTDPYDYAIVVATANNTSIYIDGSAVPTATINAGQYYDWTMTGAFGAPHSFVTNNPVYLYHVSGASQDDEVDMSIMPQLECTGSRYIEFSKFTANTNQQILQILASPGAWPTLKLNGVPYASVPSAVINNIPGLSGWKAISFPTASLANNNVVQSDGFFHAGWLTGTTGNTGAFGYLSGFDDAFEFLDPSTNLPTNIYNLGPLCQGQSLDHCMKVYSCAGDNEISAFSGNVGTIVIAPPTSPSDSCLRYTAPFNFVGVDTVLFTVTNSLGFEGQVEIAFTVINPNTPIDAGPNQILCSVNTTSLSAVNPDPLATGYWTVAQGTGILATPNSPNTTVSNLSAGANSFIWHQDYAACNVNNVDIVQVFVYSGTPPTANAGPDANLCSGTNYTMQANNPGTSGTGTWEILSGNATIFNINSATAQVTNLAIGVNTFRWNISNGACAGGETSDIMVINVFNQNHPAANAGADQSACQGSFATLAINGSVPQVPATGQWSVISGSAAFGNANAAATTVAGLSIGQNVIRWTINNGPCGTLIDDLIITVYNPLSPAANAGPDQYVCLPTNSATLAGNTLISPAVGTWAVIQGTGSFSNANSPSATVSGLSLGLNRFRWTSINGPCANSVTTDDIIITVYPATQPAANAGPDQSLCFTGSALNATLTGSSVTAPGTGLWTVVNGSGTFGTPTNSTTTVTGMGIGTNTFQWTVTNGPCGTPQSDQIVITVFNNGIVAANAGPDAQLCTPTTFYTMQATAPALPATGTWTLISGSGTLASPNSPVSTVSNLAVGTNVFRWTINNGPCVGSNFDEMTIFIFSNLALPANAGPDQTFCYSGAIPTIATMAGNAVTAPATGAWTLISGGGVITSASNPTTTITSLPIGINTFQWTISNGTCGSSNDQVSLYVYNPAQTNANAGADQQICSTTNSVSLIANPLLFPATGQWTVVSGTGVFGNASNPSTTVTGMSLGTNVYQWTINNGLCSTPAVLSDQVAVTVFNSAQANANAGPDQSICSSITTVNLSGNTANFPAIGQWSVIAGSGSFSNSASPVSTVSGLSIGMNIFQWTINNGPCGAPSTDQMSVTVYDVNAPVANAGPDQSICLPTTSVTLAGNTPTFPATGLWTLVAGTGTFSNASLPNSIVNGLSVGLNTFQWTINNGACGSITSDIISVFVFDSGQSGPNAGPDASMCTPQSTYTMQANNVIFPAVGTWTLISGTGTISNVNDPFATITGLGVGTNVYRWTITNGPCPAGFNTDDINIFVFDQNQAIANAGPDQSFCFGGVSPVNTIMNASAVVSPGSGLWTLIQGSGTITNPSSPTTTITGLGVGQNIFQWTVSNGPCAPPSTNDQVSIYVYPGNQPAANAGSDQELCSTNASTTLVANSPILPGSGAWTVVQGSGVFANATSATTGVSGLSIGTNIFQWTIFNGPCVPASTSDLVTVTVFDNAQAAANAGSDFSICSSQSSIALSGNAINFPASGLWTLISGTGIISAPTSASTSVSGLSIGQNVFAYTISNGPCNLPTTDQIVVTVYSSAQTNASAGADQSICLPQTTASLTANALIAPATGVWTLISGTGIISSPTNPSTSINGLSVGQNIFRWTINNGPCVPTVTFDEVSIFIYDNTQSPANAGSDQSFCEPISSAVFNANSAIYPAFGQWVLVSGSGTIVSPNSPTSQVTGLTVGENIFQWTISNGPCPGSVTSDLMSIFIFDDNQLDANAGADQFLCTPNLSSTLIGSALIFPGSGTWTLISGSGSIVSANSSTTFVTGLDVGENVFRWTVSNGPCSNALTTDDVSIFVYDSNAPAADAGPSQSICTPISVVTMSANSAIFPGVGTWTLISGSGTIVSPNSPNTLITDLAVGENIFEWTIDNGSCGAGFTTSLVSIFVFSEFSPDAFAGADQNLCTPTTETILTGNIPIFPAYGEWTLISGTGTIVSINNPFSFVTDLGIGPNVFRWTIYNGPCVGGVTIDDVTITLFNGGAATPFAGNDQELCSPNFSTFMNATPAEFPGVGTWTLISGTGTFGNPNDPSALVSGLSIGVNVFEWTVDYSTCGSPADQVVITVYDSSQEASDAGSDQELCNLVSSTTMNAQSVIAPGYGTWSFLSGSGAISNTFDPQTSIDNLEVGANVFVWTVYNGACLAQELTTDTVVIYMFDLNQSAAFAGDDQEFCTPTNSTTLMAGSLTYPASGLWELIQGTGTISNPTSETTSVSGLSVGENIFRWSQSNGPCPGSGTIDEVSIFIFDENQPTANAGLDQSFCSPTSDAVLQGNGVIFPASGMWSLLSGTGTIADPSDPNSAVSGLSIGENIFQWRIQNGPCAPATSDIVSIFVYDENNPIANAGLDQEMCLPINSTNLEGSNYIFPATGAWSLVIGGGTIVNPIDANTSLTDLPLGINVFVWTISNGPCANSLTTDTVSIIVFDPDAAFAFAGDDQELCTPATQTTMTAAVPDVPGIGTWSIVSGTATIADIHDPNTNVSNLLQGETILEWTVYNGPCATTSTTDQVSIFIFDDTQISADAGDDQDICTPQTTASLSGNSLIFPATGQWILVSGQGDISNPTSPNTQVSNLGIGANVFQWSISNGPCDPQITNDTMVINVFSSDQPVADAGSDQEFCLPTTSSTLSGSAIVGSSAGEWSVIVGGGTIVTPDASVTDIIDLPVGENIFVWSVNNGSCGTTSDTVSVFIYDPNAPSADAGEDVSFCTPTSTYDMTGNAPLAPGVGTWLLISGTGTIANVNDPNTNIAGLTVGENVFSWTIYNGPCAPPTVDLISIFIYDENQPAADAGDDQEICLPADAAVLSGNALIFPSTGLWTLVSGGGTIADATSATTDVTNLPVGINIFSWSISNGPCPNAETTDEVAIYVYDPDAPSADAGEDQFLCTPVTSTQLTALSPAIPGVGTWTVINGTGTFSDINDPAALVSGLSIGENVLQWIVYNGPCANSNTVDLVSIFVYDSTQSAASAGTDQYECTPNTTVQMAGSNVVFPSIGTWTIIQGNGTILDINDPNTVVSNLDPGVNILEWTVDNGACENGITTDQVSISIFNADLSPAYVGDDQELCLPVTSTTVQALPLSGAATGVWTLISGSGVIVDPTNPTTDITDLVLGVNTFVWLIDNGPCGSSSDTLSISVFDPNAPSADAGPDGFYCTPTSTHFMAANTPAIPGVGAWTLITGTGLITDIHDPNTLISGLTVGENIFIWSIYNGPCAAPTLDVMSIFIYNETTPNANAGDDIEICLPQNSVSMLASAAEFPAIGVWSVIQGSATIGDVNSPNATMFDLPVGTNILVWTVDNGPCPNGITSDTVEVRVYDPGLPLPSAGPDQDLCVPISVTVMNASPIADPNFGYWTLIAGSGTITNENSPISQITGLAVGINTFTWTLYNGTCENSLLSDTVNINVYDLNQPPADAGPQQELCFPIVATTLDGNTPITPATGLWTVISGTGSFDNDTFENGQVSGLSIGTNVLQWSIDNGPCANAQTTDQVAVLVFDPNAPSAQAGEDVEICTPSSCVGLNAIPANDPQTGTWTILSALDGNGAIPFGTIDNINDPSATICGLSVGVHTLQWELYNGPCNNDTQDTIVISVFDANALVANAGSDQELCGSNNQTQLSGSVITFPGVGTWTVESGPGSPVFADIHDPNTTISGLQIGITTLSWSVYNGPCGDETSDNVIITVYDPNSPNASAGPDQYFCENLPDAIMAANIPIAPAIGTWTTISGDGTYGDINDPTTTISDIPLNQNIYVWTIYNGSCPNGFTSDTISVYVNDLTVATANAGADVKLCGSPDSLQLQGSVTIGLATSIWTIIQGGGDIADVTNNNPEVFGIPNGINIYEYTVDNGECGTSSDQVTVIIFDPELPAANSGVSGEICEDEFTSFNLMGNAVDPPAFGWWSIVEGPIELSDSTDAEAIVQSLGQIITDLVDVPSTLVWTIDNGVCGLTSDTVIYILQDCVTVDVPDAFSPNGDGVNDTWMIPNITNYPNNSLKVFNRWGVEVYNSTPYKGEWEGNSIHPLTLGEGLPVSTYYYILDLGEGGEVLTGFVYLKR